MKYASEIMPSDDSLECQDFVLIKCVTEQICPIILEVTNIQIHLIPVVQIEVLD